MTARTLENAILDLFEKNRITIQDAKIDLLLSNVNSLYLNKSTSSNRLSLRKDGNIIYWYRI